MDGVGVEPQGSDEARKIFCVKLVEIANLCKFLKRVVKIKETFDEKFMIKNGLL